MTAGSDGSQSEKRPNLGYNFIYGRLVEGDDDMLGLIAYSFYKQRKIEFVKAFQESRGRKPSEAELELFYITSNSDSSISSYKNSAEALAREFVEALLSEQLEELRVQNNLDLARRVKRLTPGFWNAVAVNIASSVLLVLAVGVIIFATWSYQYGPVDAVRNVVNTFNVETARDPSQALPPKAPEAEAVKPQ